MWLTCEYEAVTLFSLKLSTATSSGGKTLLCPTPYAIKLALLDAACRITGVAAAERRWPELRDLQIALSPAPKVVVSNLFQRILKPYKNPPKPGIPDFGPFQRTIGYREYAHLFGPLGLGLGWTGVESREWLAELLLHITYLGKRGGFVQLIRLPEHRDELPALFVDVTSSQTEFGLYGTLQVMDDCTPALTFAKANIYSNEKVRLGKERVTRNIVFPYRLTRSSKSFSLYERVD